MQCHQFIESQEGQEIHNQLVDISVDFDIYVHGILKGDMGKKNGEDHMENIWEYTGET